ncbi:Transcription termination factor MTERF15, mitochondrial [Linum perenne]
MSRIAVLKGLGFSEGTIRRVLEGFPRVIMMKEGEIHRRVEFLNGIGIDSDGVDWVLYSVPEVLGFGIENRLMPLLTEFEQLGFSKELVRKEILVEPRILGMEVGELTRCMELLGSLKCREPIKLKIFRNGELRAGFDVKLRIDCLCKHGLTHRDAFAVLWKEPRVIAYDLEETDKRIQYLVNTMRFSARCLVEVPEYLGVSFEKQIVPRYSVIQYLRAKGGLGDEVGLKGIVKPSRLRFYNFYVKPYPECEKLYGRFSGEVRSKTQHPAGMWKLFKSPGYPESKEDVKNMRSFMDPFP